MSSEGHDSLGLTGAPGRGCTYPTLYTRRSILAPRFYDVLQPPDVNPYIIGQLGVEARAKHVALSNRNYVISFAARRKPSQDLDGALGRIGPVQHLINHGRANEDSGKGGGLLTPPLAEEWQVYILHETLQLATEMVAMDLDIEPPDEFLSAPFRSTGLLTQ